MFTTPVTIIADMYTAASGSRIEGCLAQLVSNACGQQAIRTLASASVLAACLRNVQSTGVYTVVAAKLCSNQKEVEKLSLEHRMARYSTVVHTREFPFEYI